MLKYSNGMKTYFNSSVSYLNAMIITYQVLEIDWI